MAITQVIYHIFKEAAAQKILPVGGAILEFGEANWYGDLPVAVLKRDIETLVKDPILRQRLLAPLGRTDSPTYMFDVAKVFYGLFVNPSRIEAIDPSGTAMAQRLDLNHPQDLGRRFELTVNNGTAEHIFNIGQFFKTMHDHTAAGGLMVHAAPFTGWFNHGFYNLQPTLFVDLVVTNDYRVEGFFLCQNNPPSITQIRDPKELLEAALNDRLPRESSLMALVRKARDAPFVYPNQGYYAGRLSPEEKEAWLKRGGA
ncbi:MAG: hypothetical protein H7841_00735 [Magnetospirillum sp. WYHS-4]